MKKIRKALIFFSGASNEILDYCPSIERNRFANIGLVIMLNAVLAIVFMSYSIGLAINNMFLSILLGCLWGALIFTLDGFIVSGLKRGNKRRDFAFIIVRCIYTLLTTFIIAYPLIIQLLQSEINIYIAENNLSEGFLNRSNAFISLYKSSKNVYWTYNIIYVLIFISDISPVLLRYLYPVGVYDYIISSAVKVEIDLFKKVQQDLAHGEYKIAINNLFEISRTNNLGLDLEPVLVDITQRLKEINEALNFNQIDNAFAYREKNRLHNMLLQIVDELKEKRILYSYKFPVDVKLSSLPNEVIKKGLTS